MDSAILVERVSKSYGRVRALTDVDLDVSPGSILGLVGPNGAGKTTLIRILVGALRADSGVVRVHGADPFTERRSVRANIGYMPQSPVLYRDLTAFENIEFFARGHMPSGVNERVAAALDFVDLNDSADRPVHTLSGGLQQRVSLAAALVHQPQVLFLDEPTAGVDPELRHSFWLRFRHLAASGTTLLISTHQMDEVVHCDRVAIMRSGVVLANTAPGELLASGGATVRVRTRFGTTEHRIASPPEDLPRILDEFGLHQSVERIEIENPTLEDVILRLVRSDEEQDGAW